MRKKKQMMKSLANNKKDTVLAGKLKDCTKQGALVPPFLI